MPGTHTIVGIILGLQIFFVQLAFVSSLAPLTDQHSIGRREIICASISIFATAATTPLDGAWGGIDVSGLKVENPTATDIFLGGPYYPDDDLDREGVDGRISRMKYSIDLAPSGDDFSGLYRTIKVKGTSTAISSSRDDYIELSGTIFQCSSGDSGGKQGGQCIKIDFSPMGGPKDVQGYWDETEKGIRFVRDNKVWSKQ